MSPACASTAPQRAQTTHLRAAIHQITNRWLQGAPQRPNAASSAAGISRTAGGSSSGVRRGTAAPAAAASAGISSSSSDTSGSPGASEVEELLGWVFEDRLEEGAGSCDPAHAARLTHLAQWLHAQSVSPAAAVRLVLEHEHEVVGFDDDAELAAAVQDVLQPKFDVFKRLTSAEPGWADALAAALQAGSSTSLLLPPPDFEAALQFLAAQLQRVSRRRYEELHQPYSLYRFVQLHPEVAGGVLGQHPRPFLDHAAPWLRRQLLWDNADVADAALSHFLPALCQLDTQQAQCYLDWLLGVGLTQRQAGQLLVQDVRLLAAPPRQLTAQQQRVDELADSWRVAPRLAAALLLAQPALTAGAAERTGQLLEALQVQAGMGEEQLLLFVLGGGLRGGCTLNQAATERATERLKQLLLVYGSWADVADALVRHPDALSMTWQGLGALLAEPQQQHAWRLVAGISSSGGGGSVQQQQEEW